MEFVQTVAENPVALAACVIKTVYERKKTQSLVQWNPKEDDFGSPKMYKSDFTIYRLSNLRPRTLIST